MKEKILREHYETFFYSKDHWTLLKLKRERAIELLEMFKGLNCFTYGSIARGNVHEHSDIDIVFLDQIPAFQIELILYNYGYEKTFREIIMATPKDIVKLCIHLSELESITVPLSKPEKGVIEFYDFGGKVNLAQLKSDVRVPEIDKRLVLIKPTLRGHEEFSVINNEVLAVKEVGISIETINERKKVLLRREKHGKTGVFLKRQLDIHESTEIVLKKLANNKSIVRKKIFLR